MNSEILPTKNWLQKIWSGILKIFGHWLVTSHYFASCIFGGGIQKGAGFIFKRRGKQSWMKLCFWFYFCKPFWENNFGSFSTYFYRKNVQFIVVTSRQALDKFKCKLNISSFLTLPHLSDCLICTRNSVSIILLLWMMGGWDRWGVVASYQGLGGGTGGGYYLLVSFLCLFLFVLLSFGFSDSPLSDFQHPWDPSKSMVIEEGGGGGP